MRKSFVSLCFVLTLAQNSSYTFANDEVAELCFECHTADNNTPDPIIPKLNGQDNAYLLKEINSFRIGRRNDTTMIDIARRLTNEKQILEIIQFYSSQPVMSGSPDTDPIVERGRIVYQAKKCDFCHGIEGRCKNTYIKGAPVIGGQNSGYLYKTLLELRNNTRPTDNFGLMYRSLINLTSDDIEAISRYLATL